MSMGKTPGRRSRAASTTTPAPAQEAAAPPKAVVQGASSLTSPDPVGAAAADVRAAFDRLQDSEAAVLVAQAQLEEQSAAAPRLSPRLAGAVDAVDAAKEEDATARAALADAHRAVEDRAGDVRVADAALDDLASSTKRITVGQQARADEKHAKALRAETAAQSRLEAAERRAELAEHRLAAAEEHLVEVRQDRGPESSKVVAARAKVDKALRTRESAQVAYAAAQERYAAMQQAAAEGDPTAAPALQHFQSLEEFVTDYVLENWERPNTSDDTEVRWCAKWWEHPEAITRLEHVWEAFEAARREPPPAMSSWWRDHLDHHMARLTDPAGPFHGCDHTNGTHVTLPPWGSDQAPAGMFVSNLHSETAVERRKVRDIAEQRAASKPAQREGVSA